MTTNGKNILNGAVPVGAALTMLCTVVGAFYMLTNSINTSIDTLRKEIKADIISSVGVITTRVETIDGKVDVLRERSYVLNNDVNFLRQNEQSHVHKTDFDKWILKANKEGIKLPDLDK